MSRGTIAAMRVVASLLVAASLLAIAGCGSTTVTTPPLPSAAPSAAPSAGAASASASAAPTENASPAASEGASPSPAVSPTAASGDEGPFWESVRAGIASAGHLVVTATGPSPVVLRYRATASAALVDRVVVSICAKGRSWSGDTSGYVEVGGAWLCGPDALVAGFRTTGAPIDAWSADFPIGADTLSAVTTLANGHLEWRLQGDVGGEGDVQARLELDPASGRLLAGTREDETGTTTWTFDYATPVAAITAP